MKGLLIDFDGTLVDSVPILFKSYCSFMFMVNVKPTYAEFIAMNGFTVQEMVACVRSWHELEPSFEELLRLYEIIVGRQYQKAKLFDGAAACLKWVHEQSCLLGLVTASREEWVYPILVRESLLSFFSCRVTNESVTRGKPDPEGFLKGLELLKLSSQEVIAIEDSEHGILAAKRAGLKVIQFVGGEKFKKDIEGVEFRGGWRQILTFLRKDK